LGEEAFLDLGLKVKSDGHGVLLCKLCFSPYGPPYSAPRLGVKHYKHDSFMYVDGVKQALVQFERTVAIAEEERRRHPEMPTWPDTTANTSATRWSCCGFLRATRDIAPASVPGEADARQGAKTSILSQQSCKMPNSESYRVAATTPRCHR
jgi:hypothetical protein